MNSSYLPIALRAYTERVSRDNRQARLLRPGSAWPGPECALVFDTETTTDASQRLVLGSYRYLRLHWEKQRLAVVCVEEGLFFADDLPQRDPQGLAVLEAYALARRADVTAGVDRTLKLLPCRLFAERVLYRAAYKVRAIVVCFNLPFDVSRIAHGAGKARGRFQGGFSLALWGYVDEEDVWHESRYRPHLAIKTIDSKRALKGFTRPAQIDAEDQIPEGARDGSPDPAYAFRGHLLDLRTLTFALTDEGHSLESACRAFGVEHGKHRVSEHGRITVEYIDYNRQDVRITAELFVKLMEEYAKHPIELQPTKAYSPASIGKDYLHAMGIRPILERQPDFPKDVLGVAMTAYFGGRAECHIRRVPVPVVMLDFRSMYPTLCCLMGMMRFLTCGRIEAVDVTVEVRAMLASVTLDYCLELENWQRSVGFVQVRAEGGVLPVRSRYAEDANWQIGVNPLTSAEPVWVTISDAIAATLLTGKPPRVLRAIRFVPRGTSAGLRQVALRGAVLVDPRSQDFFQVVVEERQRVKTRGALPKEERERLDGFLKVLVNATSYGIFAEMVREELPPNKREKALVYGLEATPFTVKVTAPESPGEFAFPPVAACITGGARLMLAMLERMLTQAGGTYAFCDTDSMAVVATQTGGLVPCPGGPEPLPDDCEAVRALSWAQVEQIRDRFAPLNPYDRKAVPGSILRLEEENLDPATGQRRQLWCYCISAKRYVLFNLDDQGKPTLRDWKEHGFGHLLGPMDPDDGSRDWIRTLWEGIVTEALGQPYTWPQWISRPAVGRITISHPSILRLFEGLNRGRPYADQVKPYNFLLTVFVAPFGHPAGVDPQRFHLVAPWNPDPRHWLKMIWTDRYSGRTLRATTVATGSQSVARVQTYTDVLAAYRVHPEPKSLGLDERPCGRDTVGLLRRRPVTATHVAYIGKESNRLEEVQAGIIHGVDEVLTEYPDPRHDPWRMFVLPILRGLPARVVAEKSGLHLRTVKRIRSGEVRPHHQHRLLLTRMAARAARDALRRLGLATTNDDLAACFRYLAEKTHFGSTQHHVPLDRLSCR